MFSVLYGKGNQWADVTHVSVSLNEQTWSFVVNVPAQEKERMKLYRRDPARNVLKCVKVIATTDDGETVHTETVLTSGKGLFDHASPFCMPVSAFVKHMNMQWHCTCDGDATTELEFYNQNRRNKSCIQIPWSYVIEHGLVNDPRLRSYLHTFVTRRQLSSADTFTCCQHERYAELAPLWKEIGVRYAFISHKRTDVHDVAGIVLLPCANAYTAALQSQHPEAEQDTGKCMIAVGVENIVCESSATTLWKTLWYGNAMPVLHIDTTVELPDCDAVRSCVRYMEDDGRQSQSQAWTAGLGQRDSLLKMLRLDVSCGLVQKGQRGWDEYYRIRTDPLAHTTLALMHKSTVNVVIRISDRKTQQWVDRDVAWIQDFVTNTVWKSIGCAECAVYVFTNDARLEQYQYKLKHARVMSVRWTNSEQVRQAWECVLGGGHRQQCNALTMYASPHISIACEQLRNAAHKMMSLQCSAATWKPGSGSSLCSYEPSVASTLAHTAYYESKYHCDPVLFKTEVYAQGAVSSSARCLSRYVQKQAACDSHCQNLSVYIAGTYCNATDAPDANISRIPAKGVQTEGISVIVPAHRSEYEFLRLCVESLVAATAKSGLKLEVLLGVDGCVETLKAAQTLRFDMCNGTSLSGSIEHKVSLRIFWFTENNGPYIVRNTLAQRSKYERLLFFDADDIIDVDSVNGAMSMMDEGHAVVRMSFSYFTAHDASDAEHDYALSDLMQGGTGQFFTSRSLVLSMNGFHPWKCGADFEFKRRLHQQSVSQAKCGLFFKRKHRASLTSDPLTNKQSYYRELLNHRHVHASSNPNPVQLCATPNYVTVPTHEPFVVPSTLAQKHTLCVVMDVTQQSGRDVENRIEAVRQAVGAHGDRFEIVCVRLFTHASEYESTSTLPRTDAYVTVHAMNRKPWHCSRSSDVAVAEVASYQRDVHVLRTQTLEYYDHVMYVSEQARLCDVARFIEAVKHHVFTYDVFVCALSDAHAYTSEAGSVPVYHPSASLCGDIADLVMGRRLVLSAGLRHNRQRSKSSTLQQLFDDKTISASVDVHTRTVKLVNYDHLWDVRDRYSGMYALPFCIDVVTGPGDNPHQSNVSHIACSSHGQSLYTAMASLPQFTQPSTPGCAAMPVHDNWKLVYSSCANAETSFVLRMLGITHKVRSNVTSNTYARMDLATFGEQFSIVVEQYSTNKDCKAMLIHYVADITAYLHAVRAITASQMHRINICLSSMIRNTKTASKHHAVSCLFAAFLSEGQAASKITEQLRSIVDTYVVDANCYAQTAEVVSFVNVSLWCAIFVGLKHTRLVVQSLRPIVEQLQALHASCFSNGLNPLGTPFMTQPNVCSASANKVPYDWAYYECMVSLWHNCAEVESVTATADDPLFPGLESVQGKCFVAESVGDAVQLFSHNIPHVYVCMNHNVRHDAPKNNRMLKHNVSSPCLYT